MFILTQASPLENLKDNVYRVEDKAIEKQYLANGYKKYERIYKLKYQRKAYEIICPEFRKAQTGSMPVVVTPEYLVAGRPYPIEVYLYAIDKYSNNPKLGQRAVAEETRKRFKLATFAHTTLGRALKSFVNALAAVGAIDKPTDANTNTNTKKNIFPTKEMTRNRRKSAAEFLQGQETSEEKRCSTGFLYALANKWMTKYNRFLL